MTRELEESRQTVTCAVCVELFRDSRVLNCSHSFCFQCLIGCQTGDGLDGLTETNCPVCRELTVPPLADIHLLPENVFANKVAECIRSHDTHSYEHQSHLRDDDRADADSQFFLGDLLPEPTPDHSEDFPFSLNTIGVIAASILLAGCIHLFIGTWLSTSVGILVVVIASFWVIRLEQTHSQNKLYAYTCNGCSNVQTSILRFRCGMCNDFMFCPACFAEDNLSQRQHIFLKLKFPQRRQLPLGPVLKQQAFGLAETFDYEQTTHGRAYVHSSDRLLRLPGIKCRSCDVTPIKGLRYKCGMCSNYDLCSSCEARSDKIHDKSHVFMVLKFKAEINVISEPLLRAQFY